MSRSHQTLFQKVSTRSSMYGIDETYSSASAYVLGYDAATQGGLLNGFREWLLVRLGDPALTNLGWTALVLYEAFPDSDAPHNELRTTIGEARAFESLFRLIQEFDVVVCQYDGLRKIFFEYEHFCRKHGIHG